MKNKIKLFWITGSNFYSVDEPLMSELNHIFDIFWVILIQHNDKEKEYIEKSFSQMGIQGKIVYLERFRSLQNLHIYNHVIKDLKKGNYDFFYINFLGMPYFIPLLFISGINSKKLIYACHDFVEHKDIKKRRFISQYKKLIFQHVKTVKLFSYTQYKFFKIKYPNLNSFYTPLCLQNYGMPSIKKENNNIVHFLFFGLIRENKGLEILIKAGNLLYTKFPGKFIIDIYGKADNWDNYNNMIEYAECFNLNIRHIYGEEIPNIFTQSDYIVLPYKDVTQSGPLSIAYNYNLPVIASDHDGFKEFIEDKKNGFLFKNNNAMELFKIMSDILQNKYNYNQIKVEQKKYTEQNLQLSNIIQGYKKNFIALYHKIYE